MVEPGMDSSPYPARAKVARIVAACAALVGLAASAALLAPYLVHVGFCKVGGGCDRVAQSPEAIVFGVPRAAIGVVAFVVAVVVAIAPGARLRRISPLIGVIAALEAARLIALQLFVIHAICPFCVVADSSAIVFGAALVAELVVDRRRDAPTRPRLAPIGFALATLLFAGAPIALAALRRPPPRKPVAIEPLAKKDDGRLVVREFVDLECPFCRATHVALSKVLTRHPGYVVERHHVPLPQHTHAMGAAIAACCAGEQGAEDKFIDCLVARDEPPSVDTCRDVAKTIALDLGEYDRCCASPRPSARISTDLALAETTSVDALPTIDLEGERHVGGLDEPDAEAFLARHTPH